MFLARPAQGTGEPGEETVPCRNDYSFVGAKYACSEPRLAGFALKEFRAPGLPGRRRTGRRPTAVGGLLWLAYLCPGPLAFGRRRATAVTTSVFLPRCGASSPADTAYHFHASQAPSSCPASRATYSSPPNLLTHLPTFQGQGTPWPRAVGGVRERSAFWPRTRAGRKSSVLPIPGQTGRPAGVSTARKQGPPRPPPLLE